MSSDDFTLTWNGELWATLTMDASEAAIKEGAEVVLKKAKALCPVESEQSIRNRRTSNKVKAYGAKSGSLRKSGRITVFRKADVVGAYIKFGGIVVDGVDTYYAPWIELGTPGTEFKGKRGYFGRELKLDSEKSRVPVEAKPFMRPALKSSTSTLRNKFKNLLK